MLGELSGAVRGPRRRLPSLRVSERERTDADPDLEFDFFEDLPTTERAPRQPPPPPPKAKRGGGPPIRPRAPGGGTPILRLAALVGVAIVVAVVIVLWVTSCTGDGAKDSYADYLSSVGEVVAESNSIGEELSTVITSRGATLDDIDAQLDGLATQQAQVVAQASSLEPPGALLNEQQSLVESMQLLESGLAGLQQAFGQIQLASSADTEGQALAQQAARLVAGEVVYADLFRAQTQEVMRDEDVTGVAVPELDFLQAGDLVSQGSLTEFVERLIEGGGTAGEPAVGLHGNGIDSVSVAPSDQTLSQTDENTIAASDQLQFVVSITNSGEFQETQVPVTLVIQFSGGPIRKTEEVDVINSNQTTTVTFSDFANITFGEPTTLTVSVQPVPGEENTSNNTAEFPVIFTLE
jgi:hypothetical protein